MSAHLETRIPRRVLIIDEDASTRETALNLLEMADIEAAGAQDGEAALTLSMRRWFPVLLTNRHVPIIDGIELVQRIRATAIAPAYVIMLSDNCAAEEYESGYCAGVDHFLPRPNLEAELVARANSGFTAIRRRQSTRTSHGEGSVIVDLASGAHTARHLIGRLHAEIALAARRRLPLTVISACIESGVPGTCAAANQDEASVALLAAVQESIQPGLHWVARLPAVLNRYRLAIVLPQSDASEVAAVEQGIRNAFAPTAALRGSAALQLSMGAATLTHGDGIPTALELLGESERSRRGLSERPAADLHHVQGEAEADTQTD